MPKIRLLLVEDNAGDARLIREMLKEADGIFFEVSLAAGLKAALDTIREDELDTILLDLNLPDSRGLETLDRVLAEARRVPVIILTGLDDKDSALAAIKKGAQEYLVKGQFHGDVLVRLIQYAIERKRMETDLQLAADALRLLNRPNRMELLVSELIGLIKKTMDFDAVGLRLRSGEDFPYYVQNGFSDAFVKEENFLCAKGPNAAILRDDAGRPVLDCTCGVVLSGRADSALPFFTKGGSFWTNTSSELLRLAPEADPRTNARNRCIHSGYESVALIPLRSGNEIIGLLQLNDRRTGRFTPDQIRFFESLGESIGIALKRKQAEEALTALSVRYEAILQTVPEIIAEVNIDKIYTWVNQAGRQFFGEDVVGKEAAVYFEGEQDTYHKVQPIFGGSSDIVYLESWQRRRDGEKRFLAWWFRTLKDAAGNVIGALSSARDITDNKQAEEDLRESEDKFKYVFDHSVIGKSITLPSGEVNSNRALAEMLGYSVEELNRLKWQDITHPDDIDLTQKALDPILAGAKDSVRFVKRYIRKDGAVVWGDVGTSLRRDRDGRPLYFMSAVIDVTERMKAEEALRESEERFREVFEKGPIGMVITSRDLKFFSANPAFCRMLGYRPEEMCGRTFLDVTHPDHRETDRANVERMWRGEIPFYRTVKRYLTKDGEVRWGSLSASLIRGKDGAPLYSVAIIEDISERTKAEERNAEQLEELRRWHQATLGRESRILELKREVNQLLAESGRSPRYASVASSGADSTPLPGRITNPPAEKDAPYEKIGRPE